MKDLLVDFGILGETSRRKIWEVSSSYRDKIMEGGRISKDYIKALQRSASINGCEISERTLTEFLKPLERKLQELYETNVLAA